MKKKECSQQQFTTNSSSSSSSSSFLSFSPEQGQEQHQEPTATRGRGQTEWQEQQHQKPSQQQFGQEHDGQNRTNRQQFVRANPSLFLFNSASRARTRTAGRRQPQFARQEHDAHKPSPKIPLAPRKNTAAKRATSMNAKGTRGEKESKIGEEEDPEPGGRGGSTCLERHRPERMMGRQRDDMAPAGGGRAIFVAKKASGRWRGRRRRVSSP